MIQAPVLYDVLLNGIQVRWLLSGALKASLRGRDGCGIAARDPRKLIFISAKAGINSSNSTFMREPIGIVLKSADSVLKSFGLTIFKSIGNMHHSCIHLQSHLVFALLMLN